MRIAVKTIKIGSWLLAIGCSVAAVASLAADPGAPPSLTSMIADSSSAPSASSAAPALPPPTSVTQATVTAAVPAMAMPKDMSNTGANSVVAAADPRVTEAKMELPDATGGDKKGDMPEVKVPESVNKIIKQLTVTSKDVTLDDLNAAREAVAKLDALLDIEKRLSDLEKIRKEREGSANEYAAAIPAAALVPQTNAGLNTQSERPTMSMTSGNPDVVRIEGTNGHYAATMKSGTISKTVHVGDRLDDGSVILAITADGVEVKRGKTRHLLRVKESQDVFNEDQ